MKTIRISKTSLNRLIESEMKTLSFLTEESQAVKDALKGKKIKNPKNGKDVLILTAAANKEHPAYKAAFGIVMRTRDQVAKAKKAK